MMEYIENPKTSGSGIVCCIPQKGRCPNNCPECFFQNGRSYLEPLTDNLPNMPDPKIVEDCGYVVRVNDGNDSNVKKSVVLAVTERYRKKFYNTAIPDLNFPAVTARCYHNGICDTIHQQAPVVLTINPGRMCDSGFHTLASCLGVGREYAVPTNLMFVRLLVSPFNLALVSRAVKHWTTLEVTVVLTFMAYHEKPVDAMGWVERKRTLNSYWAVSPESWTNIMQSYRNNPLVFSCGESYSGTIRCNQCGNCIREYFATMERIRAGG